MDKKIIIPDPQTVERVKKKEKNPDRDLRQPRDAMGVLFDVLGKK